MSESAAEWYGRVQRSIEQDGYRTTAWHEWSTWPFTGTAPVRALDPPVAEEPARHGSNGADCGSCAVAESPEADDLVVWFDELAMLTVPGHGTSLPFGAMLSPRRHADLADLTDAESTHLGRLMTLVERAAIEVLDIPRIQASRWGDGGEHLHWWLFARPTGALQLRGTFLATWDDVLPARAPAALRADVQRVADRLAELLADQG